MTIEAASGLAGTLARIRQITGAAVPASGGAPPSPAPAAGGFAAALSGAQAAASGGVPGVGADWRTRSTPIGATPAGATAPAGTIAAATAPGASGVTGAQLDAWMARKNPGAPLVGLGEVFVREGERNGIDPRALVAIARAESSLGADPGARARNNAFGWGPHQAFASWEQNIATVARGLRRGYLDDGLVTLQQIQSRYAPVGAGNDPTNLNSNWLRNTTLLYAELGGDPAGSVALDRR
ncbi:glucosaminidase domain-containing protein [Miltoncostaea marina]|uniref:glucosaminidase domain-containing protein n=1 Tax=Miltoncostaea marina TaxID=2843215 RepID=UPI001C3E79BA|nr:glucosaminidase domain-containing protein [Miltoncostaea marina]